LEKSGETVSAQFDELAAQASAEKNKTFSE